MANVAFDIIDGTSTYRAILDTSISGATAMKLGNPAGPSGPATWHIQITGTGGIGSWVPKCTLRGSGLTGAAAIAMEFVAIDDTGTLLTSAQSATKGYLVAGDEWDIWIEYTADTDPMTIYARAGRQ